MIELTEVEGVAVDEWKRGSQFTTFEIATKILVSRHHSEYQEIQEEVREE